MNGLAIVLSGAFILCGLVPKCVKLKSVPSKLFSFTLVAFPLRYLVENFLQLWVTFMVEVNLLIGSYNVDYFKRVLAS